MTISAVENSEYFYAYFMFVVSHCVCVCVLTDKCAWILSKSLSSIIYYIKHMNCLYVNKTRHLWWLYFFLVERKSVAKRANGKLSNDVMLFVFLHSNWRSFHNLKINVNNDDDDDEDSSESNGNNDMKWATHFITWAQFEVTSRAYTKPTFPLFFLCRCSNLFVHPQTFLRCKRSLYFSLIFNPLSYFV